MGLGFLRLCEFDFLGFNEMLEFWEKRIQIIEYPIENLNILIEKFVGVLAGSGMVWDYR